MEFEFRTEGTGYVVTIDGDYDASELAGVWARVQAERTPSGFDFGVFDLRRSDIAALHGWDLSPEAVERLHPIARMVNANVTPGFRLAIVSAQAEMDQAIDDLLSVAKYGTSPAPGTGTPDLARHDTLESALEWCRAGAGEHRSTTVRE